MFFGTYCWWKKSRTTWDLYIPGGAWFLTKKRLLWPTWGGGAFSFYRRENLGRFQWRNLSDPPKVFVLKRDSYHTYPKMILNSDWWTSIIQGFPLWSFLRNEKCSSINLGGQVLCSQTRIRSRKRFAPLSLSLGYWCPFAGISGRQSSVILVQTPLVEVFTKRCPQCWCWRWPSLKLT